MIAGRTSPLDGPLGCRILSVALAQIHTSLQEGKDMRDRTDRRPLGCEPLESRDCPAGQVFVFAGILTVLGDGGANTVAITDDGAGTVTATIDATTRTASGIDAVLVATDGGDGAIT